jgi:hypothetical protein
MPRTQSLKIFWHFAGLSHLRRIQAMRNFEQAGGIAGQMPAVVEKKPDLMNPADLTAPDLGQRTELWIVNTLTDVQPAVPQRRRHSGPDMVP